MIETLLAHNYYDSLEGGKVIRSSYNKLRGIPLELSDPG